MSDNKLLDFCSHIVDNIYRLEEKFSINNHLSEMMVTFDDVDENCHISWGYDDKIMRIFESNELYESEEAYLEKRSTFGIVITNDTTIQEAFYYTQEKEIMAFIIAFYCAAVTELMLDNIKIDLL